MSNFHFKKKVSKNENRFFLTFFFDQKNMILLRQMIMRLLVKMGVRP
jgi:hypothetical protein